MALSSPSMEVGEELQCPICKEYLTDPVTLDCGHNFCRGCINHYCETWEELGDLECPLCKARITKGNFRPNWQLANIVEKIKHLGTEDVCVRHKKKLNLFCKEDQELVCGGCERSPEHKSHTVLLLEEAAKEYKVQFLSYLEFLKKEREDIQASKESTEKETQDLLQQTKAERRKTVAVFNQLQQFLEIQKNLFLAQIDVVEKEIAARREEHMDQLSKELASLAKIIQQIEEKRQQPARELLQDIGGTLQRIEMREKRESPQAFSPELKWRIWDVCDLSLFLDAVAKQFKDTLESGLHMQRANVTLDPDTAHPGLSVSVDGKCMRVGLERQDLPDNPERFDFWPLALGREGFSVGRYFWDIAVGSAETWAMGVARKSVKRKGNFVPAPETGIWHVGKWGGQYRNSIYQPLSLGQELKMMRVILNCAGGRVAFFNADTGVHLYTHSEPSFSRETLLPIFFLTGEAQLSRSSALYLTSPHS